MIMGNIKSASYGVTNRKFSYVYAPRETCSEWHFNVKKSALNESKITVHIWHQKYILNALQEASMSIGLSLQ